jgi:hypothetical protein
MKIRDIRTNGRWPVLSFVLPLAALLLAATPPAAWADTDIEAEETDETINSEVRALRQDQREEEKVRSKLDRLQQQHRETQFRKRTGAPFRSERSLRHDLRSNEARQGWQKSEGRRLDYEIRRQQNSIGSRSRDFRRNR